MKKTISGEPLTIALTKEHMTLADYLKKHGAFEIYPY